MDTTFPEPTTCKQPVFSRTGPYACGRRERTGVSRAQAGGRTRRPLRRALRDPLLLGLDEVANIAPPKSMPAQVSEGGGRGVATIWTAQSFATMRERYGEHATDAIVTATTAKIIQGWLRDSRELRNISTWVGEWREPSTTFCSAGTGRTGWRLSTTPGELTSRQDTSREHSIGRQYRPVLPPEAIQQLPPFRLDVLPQRRTDTPEQLA
jgi:type IV secretory pathway TraG/TraD family ATPase VirD4